MEFVFVLCKQKETQLDAVYIFTWVWITRQGAKVWIHMSSSSLWSLRIIVPPFVFYLTIPTLSHFILSVHNFFVFSQINSFCKGATWKFSRDGCLPRASVHCDSNYKTESSCSLSLSSVFTQFFLLISLWKRLSHWSLSWRMLLH